MDGTLYLGSTLFEYTAPFLQLLRDMEIGYTFFTNNSSKSDHQYVAKLKEMEMVVVGFDTDLVYDRLAQAAYWIDQGKPWSPSALLF